MQSSEQILVDLQRKVESLSKEFHTLETEFDQYKKKKEEEESRRLRMALLWAGGAIIALAGFIWTEIIWPVLKIGASK